MERFSRKLHEEIDCRYNRKADVSDKKGQNLSHNASVIMTPRCDDVMVCKLFPQNWDFVGINHL